MAGVRSRCSREGLTKALARGPGRQPIRPGYTLAAHPVRPGIAERPDPAAGFRDLARIGDILVPGKIELGGVPETPPKPQCGFLDNPHSDARGFSHASVYGFVIAFALSAGEAACTPEIVRTKVLRGGNRTDETRCLNDPH
jgi:hypothetical protein